LQNFSTLRTQPPFPSATIAQWLFGIFLVLFLGALIVGLTIGAKLTS